MEMPDPKSPVTPEMVAAATKESQELTGELVTLCLQHTFPAVMSSAIQLLALTLVRNLRPEDLTNATMTACKHVVEAVAATQERLVGNIPPPKDAN